MGRPSKTGLDYFPFDIDFFQDLKIRKLIKYQGGKSIAVYTLLLCNIYKNGYYMRWDKELPFIISEQTGFEEAYIREVISCCMKVELFSKDLYESEGILTSEGIQRRYKKINELCRRNCSIHEFNLVSSEETMITSEESAFVSESSTQRKVKKSKVNKLVDSNESTCGTSQPHEEKINYAGLVNFFNSETKGVFGMVKLPLSEKRKGLINARIKEHGKETFVEMIHIALNSPFLLGQNRNNWRATFDWLIRPTNFEKVISHNYDDKNKPASGIESKEFMRNIKEGIARGTYERDRRNND